MPFFIFWIGERVRLARGVWRPAKHIRAECFQCKLGRLTKTNVGTVRAARRAPRRPGQSRPPTPHSMEDAPKNFQGFYFFNEAVSAMISFNGVAGWNPI